MRVDGGTLYPQVETQLPSFIQNDHSNFAKFIEKYYEFLELNLITFNDLDLNAEKQNVFCNEFSRNFVE